jgi:hypothetical protein
MDLPAALARARQYIAAAGLRETPLTAANFLDFAETTKEAIARLPKGVREHQETRELALILRRLHDDFALEVERDPLGILYQPQHAVAAAFHASRAKTRYLCTGNRCSKTTMSIAEVYWHLTGQHRLRPTPALPVQGLVVGLNYSQYATTVFEPKYVLGEPGNALSPAFPQNGKWFHYYDDRKHVLVIACPACAAAGHPRSCVHPKSRLILFSDETDPRVMSGGQYGIAHLDEEIGVGFYDESRERIKTVRDSCIIVSLTPLRGEAFWTETRLTPIANRRDLIPETNIPVVERFTIDQFSAGLVAHAEILASLASMSEADSTARIFGIPATSSEHAVFDLTVLRVMGQEIAEPARGALVIDLESVDPAAIDMTREEVAIASEKDLLGSLGEAAKLSFAPLESGFLRLWEKPDPFGQYVIGADVAFGLTGRDASVASVLRLRPMGLDLRFQLVAQLYGWLDPVLYATELLKLGIFFGPAVSLAIERNGPGEVVIKTLKDLGCWFLFRDLNSQTAFREGLEQSFGIDTNIRTKSIIVSLLQSLFVLNRAGQEAISIPCAETLRELRAYVQKPTESGRTWRFEADGTEHDDRVMSLALGVYAAKTGNIYDFDRDRQLAREIARRAKGEALDEHSREFWADVHEEREAKEKQARTEIREFQLEVEDGGSGWTPL